MESGGGTGGIGYGMAGSFLGHGHRVVVCGRGGVERAVEALGAERGLDLPFNTRNPYAEESRGGRA